LTKLLFNGIIKKKREVNKMKRLGMAAMVIVMIAMIGFASWFEVHYTREDCTVVGYVEDVVTVEDTCGYTWEFKADGLEVGDVVDLKMYTNHTDSTIFDDEITDYKLVADWREVE
jgi:hypothetical protein